VDTCVALVQAYLHVNGYFTVAEYPVQDSDVLRHAPIRDAAFGVLALIDKWGVEADRGPTVPETKEDVWWRASAPRSMNDGVSC